MLLAIGTAHPLLSVALLDGATVVAAQAERVGRGHAERLLPMIAEVMAAAGVGRPTSIATDVGPGSYTGIRIGLAAARALALAWEIPIHGLRGDALVAAAAFARNPTLARVVVVLDALRDELFVATHVRGSLLPGLVVVAPGQATAVASDVGAVAGNGLSALAPLPSWCWPCEPDAAQVALSDGAAFTTAKPLYLRAPDVRPSP